MPEENECNRDPHFVVQYSPKSTSSWWKRDRCGQAGGREWGRALGPVQPVWASRRVRVFGQRALLVPDPCSTESFTGQLFSDAWLEVSPHFFFFFRFFLYKQLVLQLIFKSLPSFCSSSEPTQEKGKKQTGERKEIWGGVVTSFFFWHSSTPLASPHHSLRDSPSVSLLSALSLSPTAASYWWMWNQSVRRRGSTTAAACAWQLLPAFLHWSCVALHRRVCRTNRDPADGTVKFSVPGRRRRRGEGGRGRGEGGGRRGEAGSRESWWRALREGGRRGREEACVDDDAGDSGGLTDCSSFFFSLSVSETLHWTCGSFSSLKRRRQCGRKKNWGISEKTLKYATGNWEAQPIFHLFSTFSCWSSLRLFSFVCLCSLFFFPLSASNQTIGWRPGACLVQ